MLMTPLSRGAYVARTAETPDDVEAALQLRAACFRQGLVRDEDPFDGFCQHVLIEEIAGARLVCTYRLLPLGGGIEIGQSYAAQFYDLSSLQCHMGPMVELGRFCIRAGQRTPDILRLAWAVLAAYVDRAGVELVFGCSSFAGTTPAAYLDAFAVLRDRHLAPACWSPGVKSARAFRFARDVQHKPDPRRALRCLPPLLRSYLSMGGWVSDHAVPDADLNTLHVFTGLQVRDIPPARRRALLALHG